MRITYTAPVITFKIPSTVNDIFDKNEVEWCAVHGKHVQIKLVGNGETFELECEGGTGAVPDRTELLTEDKEVHGRSETTTITPLAVYVAAVKAKKTKQKAKRAQKKAEKAQKKANGEPEVENKI